MKVAIKKVLQDRRFKNRELSIMKRMFHPNVVTLLYYFYTCSNRSQDAEVYLNLVMDYVPENVYKQIRYYSQQRTTMPLIYEFWEGIIFTKTLNYCKIKSYRILDF